MKQISKFFWRAVKIGTMLGLFALLVSRAATGLYGLTHTYTLENTPENKVAIVFGAEVKADGSPSVALRDRVETAVALYKSGKARKLLMSGDNRFVDYNEPETMRQYAVSLGVSNSDIVLDYAGRRTYDTCYRAKAIFGVESATLVTQGFHLPRAIFLCNSLGVNAIGVEANNYYYLKRLRLFWTIRETFATMQAMWDVHIAHPMPVLGKPEPIP